MRRNLEFVWHETWPFHAKLTAWLESHHERTTPKTHPRNKAELARALGVKKTTVANWFPPNGSLPSGRLAAKIRNLMAAPLDYLFDEDKPWPPRRMLEDETLDAAADFTEEELDTLALVQCDPRLLQEVWKLAGKLGKGR